MREVARAIGAASARWNSAATLFGLAGSPMLDVWRGMGTAAWRGEAFADRRYEADGTLRSRKLPGALITDPVRRPPRRPCACAARAGADHLRPRRYPGGGGDPEGVPRGVTMKRMKFLIALAFAAPLLAQTPASTS